MKDPRLLIDTKTHFTIKNKCEEKKKKTFFITTRSIGQCF